MKSDRRGNAGRVKLNPPIIDANGKYTVASGREKEVIVGVLGNSGLSKTQALKALKLLGIKNTDITNVLESIQIKQ